jgi:hypothetical protein
VHLFPERDDRRGRWLLPAALLLSVAVHFAGADIAERWWPRFVAPALAKLLPRPQPTAEIVALSDAITIEKRTVPREAHRSPSAAHRAPPRPRESPQLRALPGLPVPTFAPLPTFPPTVSRIDRASAPRRERGTLHRPAVVPSSPAEPTPAPQTSPVPAAPPVRRLAPRQIAAYDTQFQRAIDEAQRSLTNVPPQRRPPARNPDQLRYEAIMAGTPEQFFAAFQGDCVPLEGPDIHGPVRYYYIRCMIRYNDGYFENVSYPWSYRFPARIDPFDDRSNPRGDLRFAPQGPPPGFVLPPHFALSRAICTFYRADCESIFARERANGNQPAPDGP